MAAPFFTSLQTPGDGLNYHFVDSQLNHFVYVRIVNPVRLVSEVKKQRRDQRRALNPAPNSKVSPGNCRLPKPDSVNCFVALALRDHR